MDSQEFDSKMKDRLVELTPEFDYAALDGFRARMDAEPKRRNWAAWLKYLVWPFLLLSLLGNGYLYWHHHRMHEGETAYRQEWENRFENLRSESRIDTVYVAGGRDTVYIASNTSAVGTGNFTGSTGLASRLARVQSPALASSAPQSSNTRNGNQTQVDLERASSVSDQRARSSDQSGEASSANELADNTPNSGSTSTLESNSETNSTEGTDAQASANENNSDSSTTDQGSVGDSEDSNTSQTASASDESEPEDSEVAESTTDSLPPPKLQDSAQLPPPGPSRKEMRQEKREARKAEKIKTPFGVLMGLEGRQFLPDPEFGEGKMSGGLGLLSELIISKHLRIHTGFALTRPRYDLTSDLSEVSQYGFPAVNTDLGELQNMQIRSNVLEIPLHLRYYGQLSQSDRLFFGGGLTPTLYIYQLYNFEYLQNGNAITNEEVDRSLRFFSGFAEATLGYERQLTSSLRAQIAAYGSYGLQPAGREAMPINMAGLRLSVWLDVK